MNAIPAQFINTFDDILEIDYQELFRQLLMAIITVSAILIGATVWIANRVLSWYRNGGEELIAKVSQTVYQFIVTWTPKVWEFMITTKDKIRQESISLGLMIPGWLIQTVEAPEYILGALFLCLSIPVISWQGGA